MKDKEKLTVYVPKTLESARKLFEKFKDMNLDNLDESEFFFLFERGNGEIGFCVSHNNWQVCDTTSNLFDITVVNM